MNKFLPFLLTAAIAMASAVFVVPVYAETGMDITEVPVVVVSAARTDQSTLSTPASITVITRQQIDDSGATHIVQVLRGQGGLQINDLYGDGSRAAVDMRGFGDAASSNTLLLIDGRRLNNPDIGSPDLNAIALDDVERIEIVQGSAGVLFGDQAVGGVINIITRKSGELRHSVKLSAGSYNRVNLHAMTSQALDNGINYSVSLDLRESDNYREHNESSYLNGFGKLGYDYSTGLVFAELQYVDDELNIPGALFADEVAADRTQVNPSFATDFSNAETVAARIGLVQEISSLWSFEAEITDRETDGTFRLSYTGGPPATENSTQNRKIQEFTPRFIGYIPAWNNTMLTLGADVIDSEYELSTSFGEQFNDQSQRSIYAQAVMPVNIMDVTIGVRNAQVENNLSDTGSFAVYPSGVQIDRDVTVGSLGLALNASENLRVLVRADQNYRFAKVDEFLQPAYTPAFTPVLLETQEGLSLESGVEWQQGGNTAKFVVYQLRLENEIAFDPSIFANINLEDTERRGFITSGSWRATGRLGFSASYTYTDATVTAGTFTGKDIPLVAENAGLLSADYAMTEAWQLFAEVTAKSDRVFAGDFENELGRLPGYSVVNIRAEYNVTDFVFSGRINNVLNKQYSDVGQLGYNPFPDASEAFYPSPELNFLLTAAWNFR